MEIEKSRARECVLRDVVCMCVHLIDIVCVCVCVCEGGMRGRR